MHAAFKFGPRAVGGPLRPDRHPLPALLHLSETVAIGCDIIDHTNAVERVGGQDRVQSGVVL